jgi:hypothetical protein
MCGGSLKGVGSRFVVSCSRLGVNCSELGGEVGGRRQISRRGPDAAALGELRSLYIADHRTVTLPPPR